jgi:hypothetical protein
VPTPPCVRLRCRYVPLGLKRWFTRRGVTNVTELDWWQSTQHTRSRHAADASPTAGSQEHASGCSAKITFVPAQHWSARGLWDKRNTLWGGYVVQVPREASQQDQGQHRQGAAAGPGRKVPSTGNELATFYFCGDTGYNDQVGGAS